jgi:hypothetical protein
VELINSIAAVPVGRFDVDRPEQTYLVVDPEGLGAKP